MVKVIRQLWFPQVRESGQLWFKVPAMVKVILRNRPAMVAGGAKPDLFETNLNLLLLVVINFLLLYSSASLSNSSN
jgi:hypothetical protein